MIPRTHRHLANRAFAVVAPSFWNSLPDNVLDSQSYSNFLSKLKAHYFNIAFYNHYHLLVELFNLYFTLYDASELRMGGGRLSKSRWYDMIWCDDMTNPGMPGATLPTWVAVRSTPCPCINCQPYRANRPGVSSGSRRTCPELMSVCS